MILENSPTIFIQKSPGIKIWKLQFGNYNLEIKIWKLKFGIIIIIMKNADAQRPIRFRAGSIQNNSHSHSYSDS